MAKVKFKNARNKRVIVELTPEDLSDFRRWAGNNTLRTDQVKRDLSSIYPNTIQMYDWIKQLVELVGSE